MPNIFGEYRDDVSLGNKLEEEFILYQGMTKNEIADDDWNNAAVIESKEGDDTLIYHRVDIVWGLLRQPLPLLNKIAFAVLTILQSNAVPCNSYLATVC